MEQLSSKDIRSDAFSKCIRFINYEKVQGDILEFGVYTGRSLALLSYINNKYYKTENTLNSADKINRNIYGFDSFQGLQDTDGHLRWRKNMFKYNHSYHPTIRDNELVTPEKIRSFFSKMGLDEPIIRESFYNNLNIDDIDTVGLCHIDCDLYSSTKDALNLIKDKLVSGSIIMFDDWFNNLALPDRGEQKAFNEFLRENKHFSAVPFERYATFCQAFIIHVSK